MNTWKLISNNMKQKKQEKQFSKSLKINSSSVNVTQKVAVTLQSKSGFWKSILKSLSLVCRTLICPLKKAKMKKQISMQNLSFRRQAKRYSYMKFNNTEPPLILTNSVVVLYVYDGDGQTKTCLVAVRTTATQQERKQ